VSDYVRTGDRDLEDICQTCGKPWPCDAIRLADEIERLQAYSDQADGHLAVLDDESQRLRKALDKIDNYCGVNADTPRAIARRALGAVSGVCGGEDD
jgi:hypothetical protein